MKIAYQRLNDPDLDRLTSVVSGNLDAAKARLQGNIDDLDEFKTSILRVALRRPYGSRFEYPTEKKIEENTRLMRQAEANLKEVWAVAQNRVAGQGNPSQAILDLFDQAEPLTTRPWSEHGTGSDSKPTG
ncbi:hypothetical protein DL769_006407 [Monosporascus sp. CRB-8-3]|nr:hypothetical protein DL769_006407 [Monosporascus sp. CRB-8-3]